MNEEKDSESRDAFSDASLPVSTAGAPVRTRSDDDYDDAAPFKDTKPTKPPRTLGLRLFDVWLYPILTNTIVFAMSVGATYLTNNGKARADGSLPHGKLGQWFHARGEYMVNIFKKLHMNEEQAQSAKMVFFSFADGTLIAPLVKLFEDRREQIGMWIDNSLGTTPDDKSVYKAEPKQTWGSVLEGRLVTSAIVVPTAMVFEKIGWHKGFEKLGAATAEWIGKRPRIAKPFEKYDMKQLFHVGYFEAVYTSICTTGLYFISRFIAKGSNKFEPPKPETLALPTEHIQQAAEAKQPEKETPATHQIAHLAHEGRLQAPLEHASSLN